MLDMVKVSEKEKNRERVLLRKLEKKTERIRGRDRKVKEKIRARVKERTSERKKERETAYESIGLPIYIWFVCLPASVPALNYLQRKSPLFARKPIKRVFLSSLLPRGSNSFFPFLILPS